MKLLFGVNSTVNSTVERGMMPISVQEASFVCHMSGFSHVSCSKSQLLNSSELDIY